MHLIVQKYRNHIWVLSERTVRGGGRLGIDGQSTVSSTRNEKQKSHDREQMLNEGSSAYGVKQDTVMFCACLSQGQKRTWKSHFPSVAQSPVQRSLTGAHLSYYYVCESGIRWCKYCKFDWTMKNEDDLLRVPCDVPGKPTQRPGGQQTKGLEITGRSIIIFLSYIVRSCYISFKHFIIPASHLLPQHLSPNESK